MTKPNLFSALNAAIEQRAELLTVRGDITKAMSDVVQDCEASRRALKENHVAQMEKLDDVQENMLTKFSNVLAKLDAVIGDDEVKVAA